MNPDKAARLRREYEDSGLDDGAMAEDPFTEFDSWFEGVIAAGLEEPNTFVLATATNDGAPSARAVLMKGLSEDGIVFFTNLESRKSLELKANPRAAATFVWIPLHRQVRFEGFVREVPSSVADDYFARRPRGAQVAAHASAQSTPVSSRAELEAKFQFLDEELGDEVRRPETWGGWQLVAATVEFWQGRPNRFHDRILYQLVEGGWVRQRLAP